MKHIQLFEEHLNEAREKFLTVKSVNESTDIYENGKVSITRYAAGGGKRGYQITKSGGNYIQLTAEELRALLSNAKEILSEVQ